MHDLWKTHIKKVFFFSGRTTKSVGRVSPPDHEAKNTFFSKIRLFKPKNWEEKKIQNPFQAIISGMDH